jgi:hypothetical protein
LGAEIVIGIQPGHGHESVSDSERNSVPGPVPVISTVVSRQMASLKYYSVAVLLFFPLLSIYFQIKKLQQTDETHISSFSQTVSDIAMSKSDNIIQRLLESLRGINETNNKPYATPLNVKDSDKIRVLSENAGNNTRCWRGIDYTGRDLFGSMNALPNPRPYDAFAKENLLYMIFLSRDNRKDLDLNEDNADWHCTYDGGESVSGTKTQ